MPQIDANQIIETQRQDWNRERCCNQQYPMKQSMVLNIHGGHHGILPKRVRGEIEMDGAIRRECIASDGSAQGFSVESFAICR